jgi:acetolactate synthase small subunit
VFVVKALDKPGTLTAAASVFSNRGVSLEGILGSGIAPMTAEDGRLIFSFRATKRKQELLYRALTRLSKIFQVDAYEYEDERLRAIAVAKLVPQAAITAMTEAVHVETIAQTETEQVMLLTGQTVAVDAAIAQFRQHQQLKDVVVASITI